MKKYLFDLHTHTSDNSPCSHWTPEELVDYYATEGEEKYSGLVITNHYYSGLFDGVYLMDRDWSWEKKVSFYLNSVVRARKQAEKYGMTVLAGIELKLIAQPYEDILLQGISEEFLLNNPTLWDLTLEELYNLAEKEGILVIQAHPLRFASQQLPVEFIHGVEGYNGHAWEANQNDKTLAFGKENNLIITAGSDAHEPPSGCTAGLWLPEIPKDEKHLVQLLRGQTEIYIGPLEREPT